MKQSKRILAALLALGMMSALAVGAGASLPPDYKSPPLPQLQGYPENTEATSTLFTKRMPGIVVAGTGEAFTLAPKAELPGGKTGTIQYQWYVSDGDGAQYYPLWFETGPTLVESVNSFPFVSMDYRLQAFCEADDGTLLIDNDYTRVTFIPAPNDWLRRYRDAMRADANGWRDYLNKAILTLITPIVLANLPFYCFQAAAFFFNRLSELSALFSAR